MAVAQIPVRLLVAVQGAAIRTSMTGSEVYEAAPIGDVVLTC